MMRMPVWAKGSLTVYFAWFSLLSAALVTAMYVIFMLFWSQLLVQYKTEYLHDQSLKMTFAIQDKLEDGPLTGDKLAWIESLARQYSGTVKFTDPSDEKLRLDSGSWQEPMAEPYSVELPLMVKGERAGILTVSYDLSKDNFFPYFTNMNHTARQQAELVYIVLLLSAIALSLLLALKLSKPARLKARQACTIMNGDLEAAVPVNGTNEQAQLARAINHLLAEFKQQEKWRQQLMQDLTHELRTPLTTVLSRLEAMIDGIYPLTEQNMNLIYVEIDRLSRLVKDVERLSEAEGARFALNLQQVDMEQLLKRVYEGFLFLTQDKQIRFTMHPVYVPCYAEIDPDRMIQVLSNIISNAIKYTPAGGEIELELIAGEDETVIRCKDRGIGIAAEDLPHIFNRFYRVDKSRSRESGGLGVGLSIAHVLVEAQGGMLEVVSEPGEGSVFAIRLPVMPSAERLIAADATTITSYREG